MRSALLVLTVGLFMVFFTCGVRAQSATFFPKSKATPRATASPSTSPTETPLATPTPVVIFVTPRPDLTEVSKTTVEPLKKILNEQSLGSWFPMNPIKYAIRNAVNAGVPPNTIVLLLLLPGVAGLMAAARHLIGVRGFGILIPAALAVVFLAIGPVVGIGLFLIIVFSSTLVRVLLRKTKTRMQYLPRMALIMLFVVMAVLGLLFAAPIVRYPGIINVSIFPVLFLVILAEDFTRVQLGKSFRVAFNITTETLILALIAYLLMILPSVQSFVLLNPETYLVGLVIFDFVIGRYVGLRILEYWRFRRLISS